MVNKIYDLKNRLLTKVEEEVAQRGIDRLDHDKVDMIKDLAEAEYYCMKAKYYDDVTKAMEGEQPSGYSASSGSRGSMGYQSRDQQQMGYSMGYHEEEDPEQLIQKLKHAIDTADPSKREMMRNRTLATIGTR